MGGNRENDMGIYSPYTVNTAFWGISICACAEAKEKVPACVKNIEIA